MIPSDTEQINMRRNLDLSFGTSRSCGWVFWAMLCAVVPGGLAHAQADDRDWPMYNHDVIGTRHNPGETTLDKVTARGLEEKWRFPARGSTDEIGVIHATPVVVNGYVYFGTATDPAFYKLRPDGKVRWTYRRAGLRRAAPTGKGRFQASDRRNHGLGSGHRRHGLFRRPGGLDLCA